MTYTTEYYWDCECELGYIKSKSLGQCPDCKAYSHDCADSRYDELSEQQLKVVQTIELRLTRRVLSGIEDALVQLMGVVGRLQ
jgi:hypothetical protein